MKTETNVTETTETKVLARGSEVKGLNNTDKQNAEAVLKDIKQGDAGRASYFVKCVRQFKTCNGDKVQLSNMQTKLESAIKAVTTAPNVDKELAINVIKTARNYVDLKLVTIYSHLTFITLQEYVTLIQKLTIVKKGDDKETVTFKADKDSDIILVNRQDSIDEIIKTVQEFFNPESVDFVKYNNEVNEYIKATAKKYGMKIKEEEEVFTSEEVFGKAMDKYLSGEYTKESLQNFVTTLMSTIKEMERKESVEAQKIEAQKIEEDLKDELILLNEAKYLDPLAIGNAINEVKESLEYIGA